MKIYIASSWKNVDDVRIIASVLRDKGFEVDDFTDDSKGRFVFHYSELGEVQELDAINFIKDERSQKAFQEDKKWIDWADCVLLYLPAGKSSHLEAGYAKGSGKKLIIYQMNYPKGEFDVMYGFADLITDDFQEIIRYLESAESNQVLAKDLEVLKAITILKDNDYIIRKLTSEQEKDLEDCENSDGCKDCMECSCNGCIFD